MAKAIAIDSECLRRRAGKGSSSMTISWPKEWDENEGWPGRDATAKFVGRPKLKGEGRSWAQVDAALKADGNAGLADEIETLGGPKAERPTADPHGDGSD